MNDKICTVEKSDRADGTQCQRSNVQKTSIMQHYERDPLPRCHSIVNLIIHFVHEARCSSSLIPNTLLLPSVFNKSRVLMMMIKDTVTLKQISDPSAMYDAIIESMMHLSRVSAFTAL